MFTIPLHPFVNITFWSALSAAFLLRCFSFIRYQLVVFFEVKIIKKAASHFVSLNFYSFYNVTIRFLIIEWLIKKIWAIN